LPDRGRPCAAQPRITRMTRRKRLRLPPAGPPACSGGAGWGWPRRKGKWPKGLRLSHPAPTQWRRYPLAQGSPAKWPCSVATPARPHRPPPRRSRTRARTVSQPFSEIYLHFFLPTRKIHGRVSRNPRPSDKKIRDAATFGCMPIRPGRRYPVRTAMKAVVVTCASCSRSWKLNLHNSLYLQLDLSSRPCPHCEAYTLNCRGPADPVLPRRRRRDRSGPTPRPVLVPSVS
jgi:hypothetical protein